MKISAVIITYNEEEHIGACIDSVEDVADEVVVVDSCSEDETPKICKERSVRFIEHKFEGHIEQKNFARQQAAFEYVLSLDADERLSPELQKSISTIKAEKEPADAYSFNRLNNYCGQWIRHGGWYPDSKLRLWHNDRGKWGGQNPHDRIVMGRGVHIEHLSGDILHYTCNTIEEHIEQIHSFSSIAAEAEFNAGKRTSLIKVIVSPVFKFIRDYVLKGGFLDGYYGFVIATHSAWAKYLKYLKLYELWRESDQ